ncbi:mannose-1-phosphate guanylyltransferase/mannose-6-phosphate isomerase [Hoeflea sp. TYP-13]|uniref:mannose-1-phosphate guanylyltransferase/mannose-6-phosphate isomerase n=1 Tax=Hoeflea sp. TYP-13 TaxID=3230023 RepID=UPI0034C62C48
MIVPVIVSGGVGSRLWPASRQTHPKPFLPVENGKSLLLNTYNRAASLDGISDIVTITARESSFKTVAEYANSKDSGITNHLLLEPVARDTAAATAAATNFVARQFGPDAVVLFLAADHLIRDISAFQDAVTNAASRAENGQIVTFGIEPDRPETGYGYIEVDGDQAVRFVEKPDLDTARHYVESGNFLWNSGMFCFKAGVMLDAMNIHCPEILQASEEAIKKGKQQTLDSRHLETELDEEAFLRAPKISIDYAVMEKVSNLSVVRADIGWSDVGTWSSLSESYAADSEGNTAIGDTALVDTKNCFVSSEGRLVSLVGVEDLAVVDTRDATLVVSKNKSQDVKKLFEKLSGDGHEAHASFPTGHRPWGSYTILDEGAGYKVKRIEVKPGGCLSLQSHKHRSEHWTVVQGVAHVVNGDDEIVLKSNESTYIECGNVHRMENRGSEPMTLIEVQTGSYLGEDDIVRYEDIYGRS